MTDPTGTSEISAEETAPAPAAEEDSPGRRFGKGRMAAAAVILALMAGSAAYSANVFGVRDRFLPPAAKLGDDAAIRAPGGVATAGGEILRSQPWWQEVRTFDGTGPAALEPVEIVKGALQWRAVWKCESGSLSVKGSLSSGPLPKPLVPGASCPAEGSGFSVHSGMVSMQVEATGPWSVKVEQQVDVPLVEPPLPEMADPAAQVVASGAVYDVDRTGKGTVKIYRLPDGRHFIRLEDFFVSQNTDLEIRLSELPAPKSTPEIAGAPQKQIVFLTATTGSMNYAVPKDVDVGRYRSVIIWCELTSNAYAAASLQ